MMVQVIRVYFEKNWESIVTVTAIFTVGAIDVLIVLLWRYRAADYTCILRICFVVSMRSARLTPALCSGAVSAGSSA